MKIVRLLMLLLALIALAADRSYADTAWSSTSLGDWGTVGNWTNGLPSTGPQLAIHPGTASLQKSINLGGAIGRETVGLVFTLTAAGAGYTFTGTPGASGFFMRSGGAANGIINNDDNTQTFNVPIKLLSSSGLAGAGAAQTWNAAAGHLVFNGANTAPATPWTINLNGASALTISGSFNVSVGTSGAGQIVNTNIGSTSGIIKDGTGTLFLGGSAANTFSGINTLNAGKITAGKVNALGAGNSLILNGGIFEANGFSQTLGTLDLNGAATIDFGGGTVAINFGDSSSIDWSGGFLSIANWTAGVDTLRFGIDNTALTPAQLNQIQFLGSGFPSAGIDGNGFLTPVPEPTALSIAGLGIVALLAGRRFAHSRS